VTSRGPSQPANQLPGITGVNQSRRSGLRGRIIGCVSGRISVTATRPS
jgi:hypothetical protein